ncbi:Serine/arginine-rich splicing factor 33 [Apostasia shenzhenica]|uniref:Serine/arginine-rich splicing factor 33 n=1 Tax=Apostasia shenzhenica TaxID=1088818 RepID=A0A2I0AWU7_9ASPA|nr:Serine/arginine-rich splicing factor 33 [Apostasia shenzhenica]
MDGQILLGRELTVVYAEENRKKPGEMRARERISRGRTYGYRRSPRPSRSPQCSRSRSPPRHSSRYSHSPRYARSRSRSASYHSPSPKRSGQEHSRSVSPGDRRNDQERSYSQSPYAAGSRSKSPILDDDYARKDSRKGRSRS